MDPLTIIIASLTLVVGAIAAWITYLIYRRSSANKQPPQETFKSIDDPALSRNDQAADRKLDTKLLSYFWQYPSAGSSQASWAVKESAILRGRLPFAREQPGLGVAIVSIDMALDLFPGRSESPIESCITWAVARCQPEPPYMVLADITNTVTSEVVQKPDFRHTLALAIILARTRKLFSHLNEYLELTMRLQNSDGGWPAGQGVTISELFTVIYAIELLGLCSSDDRLDDAIRKECVVRRERAILWLISKVEPSGLWISGVLKEFSWDDLVSTAWVIYRISNISDICMPDWDECLLRASKVMVGRAVAPNSWVNTKDVQRYRVEARIAAAVAVLLRNRDNNDGSRELLDLYLKDWKKRGKNWIATLEDEEWDLATVLFILDSIYSRSFLRKLAKQID